MSKEQEILRLQQELSLYQEEEQQKKWDAEQAMLHSTIVTHLHKIASRAVKASELEWKDLNCFVLNRMSNKNLYISSLTFYSYRNGSPTGLK